MRIAICGSGFPAARELLQELLPTDRVIDGLDPAEAEAGADVLIPFMTRVDGALLDLLRPRLVQQYGVGLEGVDLPAARCRGTAVANAPAEETGNAAACGEMVILHLLAHLRRWREGQEAVRSRVLGQPVGQTLRGRTVVVVGLGAVGRETVRRLAPFGVRVIGVGRRPAGELSEAVRELPLSRYETIGNLRDALAEAHAVVVCTVLTDETRGLIGALELAAMPSGGLLVNVARGPVVDRDALLGALRSGHLAGAGLDVFWEEPIDPQDEVLAENVTVSPHVAGVTLESYRGIAEVIAENVERLRDGRALLHRAA